MKNIISRLIAAALALAIVFAALPISVFAETQPEDEVFLATAERPYRREVSPEQPMWIVHIDSWNEADPEKIIDLIPEEILPYIVFNISLSINWDEEQQRFTRVEYGYETAKSWLRACAEKNVWAMIQPASGGPSHFPDYDPATADYEDTIFAEFFRDYPNFIGFNYCEQFWGFENYVKGFPITVEERYRHFAGLLELCNKYGGYLVDSWCGNEWGQALNPLAMIKRLPEFEEAARKYSGNFILLEKYTQTGYLSDMESLVLGTYLSGYCGNFGVRYDSSGWTDESGEGTGGYTLATGLPIHFERMILNGATVIDAPELTWQDDFYEADAEVDKKGYSVRKWGTFPQFRNDMVDMFEKFVSGEFRIPTREEVIARTKFILVNDVETGRDDDKYCTPPSMFDGLYMMDGDGYLKDNHSQFKKTGRYPTVPTTAGFADEKYEKLFEKVMKKTEFDSTWETVLDKVLDFDDMFPEEYTGDLYAGRYENNWVIYNPYKRNQTGSAEIPFKYNTASSISFTFPRYSSAVMQEYPDRVDIYLSNYDEDSQLSLKEDVIKIKGASSRPSYSFVDRAEDSMKCEIIEDWSDGVLTLTVKHNGPLDLSVECSGSETKRLTDYKTAVLTEPPAPPIYHGTLQHEGEFFDILNTDRIIKNGYSGNVRDYYGQGYLNMGLSEGARAKDTVVAATAGKYLLNLRYRAKGGVVDIYVNGKKTPAELENTDGAWAEVPLEVNLKKGENKVEIRLNQNLESKLYVDCMTFDLIEAGGSLPIIPIIVVAVIAVLAIIAAIVAAGRKKSKKGVKNEQKA